MQFACIQLSNGKLQTAIYEPHVSICPQNYAGLVLNCTIIPCTFFRELNLIVTISDTYSQFTPITSTEMELTLLSSMQLYPIALQLHTSLLLKDIFNCTQVDSPSSLY